jgi:hypothetical protein
VKQRSKFEGMSPWMASSLIEKFDTIKLILFREEVSRGGYFLMKYKTTCVQNKTNTFKQTFNPWSNNYQIFSM